MGQRVAAGIADILGADRVRYVHSAVPADAGEMRADSSVLLAGRRLDVSREGLPTNTITAIPVHSDGGRVGYFEVVTATRVCRPTLRQIQAALLLARQMGRESESKDL